jgi:two-component system, LytTR family, sensor kinase
MDRLILISLLVKLGVAAAVASTLARSREFQSLLYREERTLKQKIYLTVWIAIPFALGIVVRVVTPRFIAADLSFEAVMLIGVIGGRFAGALGGILIAVPAAIHGELLSLPFNVLCGLIAGMLRDAASEREMIWSFSPFVDLSLYRWVRKVLPRPKIDWQISFFLVIIGLEFLRLELTRSRWFHSYIFAVDSSNLWITIATFATVLMCIGIPLKIWNNTRIELKLEQQERLLMQARMEALQSQINPHFLFNTLNSVSSLVRFDPDTARELIVKLANILRRLLRKTDAFVPLSEEIQFIDDYLDIEVVRFGRDKLKVLKELDPLSLDMMVPSMLLQPLVENSIKHGLSPKIEGGAIVLKSAVRHKRLIIEVEDDGVGMADGILEKPTGMGGTGIGMANVAERLRVLYGDDARMIISNRPSGGTAVQLQIPLQSAEAAQDFAAALHDARSNTLR